jgi:hypothetical protein
MQISGMNLALTWSHRLCLFRVLLCGSLCYWLSPFQALGKVTLPPHCQACVFIYSSCGRWVFLPLLCSFPPTATFTSFPAPDYWAVLLLLLAAMFVYSSREKWVFPSLLWSFPPSATLTSFPAPVCWARASLPPEPLWLPGLFIYSPGKGSLPPIFSAQCAPPSFQRVLIVLIAYYSVSLFFPGWRSVCPGGYAALAQACLWENRGTTKLTWSASSQAVWALATGGPGPSLFLRLT